LWVNFGPFFENIWPRKINAHDVLKQSAEGDFEEKMAMLLGWATR